MVQVFRDAAGIRMRCFYCSDSVATDIDHFKPITIDFARTFDWHNYVWVCPVCNRQKTNKFPLEALTGLPLLVNPTREDPWTHFILDTDTGVLAPRYLEGEFDAKGDATLDVLKPINYEAAAEGRKRVVDRIREAVKLVPDDKSARSEIDLALKRLQSEVRQDDYGVAAWFGLWDGKIEQDFQELKSRNPAAWKRFVQFCVKARYAD